MSDHDEEKPKFVEYPYPGFGVQMSLAVLMIYGSVAIVAVISLVINNYTKAN